MAGPGHSVKGVTDGPVSVGSMGVTTAGLTHVAKLTEGATWFMTLLTAFMTVGCFVSSSDAGSNADRKFEASV